MWISFLATVSLVVAPQRPAETTSPSAASPNLVRILVIDGQPKTKYFVDETSYLMAFFKTIEAQDDVRHRYRVVRQTRLRLNEAIIDLVDMVFLCNLKAVSAEDAALLDKLVRRGGAVVITCGNKVDPTVYNKLLFREGRGMLPAELDDHRYLKEATPTFPSGKLNWPAAQRPTFSRVYGVKPPDASVQVLGYVGDRLPLLLVKKHGRGRCVLYTSTLDLAWSRMAVHPMFVVTMLEVIRVAKGDQIPRKRSKPSSDPSK